jgi:hypothetical protein
VFEPVGLRVLDGVGIRGQALQLPMDREECLMKSACSERGAVFRDRSRKLRPFAAKALQAVSDEGARDDLVSMLQNATAARRQLADEQTKAEHDGTFSR